MGASGETASAVAIACAEAGADVAVTSATQDADEAFAIRRLAKRISDLDRRSIAEAVDLSLGTNVQVAVRQIAKQLGGIDVLVVAADVRVVKPAERLSDSEWARVLNGNLSAVFYACRAAAREMLSKEDATDRGRIVVLLPGVEEETSAAYAAARAGIEALVRVLAAEWRERGIAVDTVVGGVEAVPVALALVSAAAGG